MKISLSIPRDTLFKKIRNLPHWQFGGSIYFITFSTRKIQLPYGARKIVLDSCLFWQRKKIKLHIVNVMPDHVHALMEPLEESAGRYYDLSTILQSVKSFSSNRVNEFLRRSGPLWEEESWDRIARDEEEYLEKWQYIFNNPVKAGLVEDPEEYPFLWYEGRPGLAWPDRLEACRPT